ncbi:methyltransferase domain-containing protein (plasmid) [Vibrio chagasii]|uniref:class I SAM-dependent methyltransferase n=1 Tax=Vibrio chagasii TaxID=170679 RepID=UPI003DAA278A
MKTYAKEYDANGIAQREAAYELGSLLPSNAGRVLDIGCGSGRVSEYFYSSLKPNRMVAIDSSKEMITEAIKTYKNSNISYINEDIHTLTIDEKFDVIIANSSLQWFENIYLALSVIYKHLSDKGNVFIQTPFKDNWCPAINLMINDFFDIHYPTLKRSFKFPCTHLESLEEYKFIFENSKLKVNRMYSKNFVFEVDNLNFIKVFNSGAIKAYSNQDNYSTDLPKDFNHHLSTFSSEYYKNKSMIKITMPRAYFLLGKVTT